LVLRVALEHLATLFGLSQVATGEINPMLSAWMDADARPDL